MLQAFMREFTMTWLIGFTMTWLIGFTTTWLIGSMWHDSQHSLVHVYDMTHSYVWHGSFICVTLDESYVWQYVMLHISIRHMNESLSYVWDWMSHMCQVTHSYAWLICATWLSHIWLIQSHTYESDSIICLIDMCNMTHWPKTRTHSQILQLSMYHLIVIWLVCDMTHPYTSYDSLICVDQVFLSVDGVVFLCVHRVFLSVVFLCVHTVLLSVVFPCVHRVFLSVHRFITCNVTQLQHTRVESQSAPFHVPNCANS